MGIKAPKTRREDYRKYDLERRSLEFERVKGNLDADSFDGALDLLREKHRIFTEDIYTFDNPSAYKSFLDRNIAGSSDSVFDHESSHARVALERGFSVEYGIAFFSDSVCESEDGYVGVQGISCQPFVFVSGDLMPRDVEDICLSPEEPSPSDMAMFGLLGGER